ncbi:FkbM family methyltransferase [Methylobacterium sp. J-026]|uniref:FkbM family methyltransferase n=1 Tax=Methylobacterium sp. J-026 TaxID=2836624 RepID=UPI001FBB225E|nr:FkbM family methyltransferase [Methylobacterium sp. J-026]MCJ2136375.1 FkbM family methyltransferase [Methylobacterium sp. J-026]
MKALAKNILKKTPGLLRLLHTVQNDKPFITRRIEGIFSKKDKVFFVQVGSNDGLHGDPLNKLARYNSKYTGILIEPVKYAFEQLKSNYGNEDRFIFCNRAVSDGPSRKFYYVSSDAKKEIPNLPEWWNQLGSFDRNHIVKHLDGKLEPYIIEDQVRCSTLSEILVEHKVDKIDFLHVDTEGADLAVLKTMDFSTSLPTGVLYEKKHLSTEDAAEAKHMLIEQDYKIFDYKDDVLGIQRSAI